MSRLGLRVPHGSRGGFPDRTSIPCMGGGSPHLEDRSSSSIN